MANQIAEKVATEEIRDDLTVYGSSVIQDKFPHMIDGLKSIQRRIIWFSKDYETTKGLNKVIGDIGDFHTGGDSSIYDAIIRLSQPFKVGVPLMRVDGKNGEYYDPSAAAAPRYLKAMLHEFARDVFFKGVHRSTLPMIPTKDFSAMEPRYLIPRLPTALFLGNTTVGFGFKSLVPMIDFTSVCDIVMRYAEYRAAGHLNSPNPKQYARLLVPSFPINNLILNKDEIIENYSRGNFSVPIRLEGYCELSGSGITLRSIPYGNDFGKITSDLRYNLKEKEYRWLWNHIVSANQLSSDEAEFSIGLKQNRNPFETLDLLRPILKFNDTINPIYNYMSNGKAIQLNPLELLALWYRERQFSIVGSLKYKQADLISKERTINAMLVVADHTDKVIKIIRESDNERAAIDNLYAAFADKKLSWKQAEIISKQRLATLAKANKTHLLSELEQNKIEQQDNMNSFAKVNETIYSDAQNLKKKYAPKTQSTIYSDSFIGYVQFGNLGIIHFTSEQEMCELLNSKGWGSVKKYIHLYDPKLSNRFIVRNKRLIPMVPSKQITCEAVVCYPDNRTDYSLVISDKGTVSVLEGTTNRDVDGFSLYPVSRNFYAVRRNGKIEPSSVNDFAIRKSVSQGRISDIVYGIPSSMKNAVIIHMNPNEPNVVRIDRILSGVSPGTALFVPGAKTEILGVFPLSKKEIYLNIPENCRKNVVIEFLIIKEIGKLFENPRASDHQRVDINKSSDLSKKLRRNQTVRHLFSLDFGG